MVHMVCEITEHFTNCTTIFQKIKDDWIRSGLSQIVESDTVVEMEQPGEGKCCFLGDRLSEIMGWQYQRT